MREKEWTKKIYSMSHSENVIGEFKELFFRRIHVIWNEKKPPEEYSIRIPICEFSLIKSCSVVNKEIPC